MLISSFQRSEELSDAMEARGYNPSAKRTRYRLLKFSSIDLISSLFTILLLIGVILLKIYNIELQMFIFDLIG